MIIVEIKDPSVKTRTFTNKETGEVSTYYSQIGWIQVEEKGYPEKFRFDLEPEQATGYAIGKYQLLQSSFFIGQYNALKIGRLHLESIEEGK